MFRVIFEAIILGIVQGVAEFAPISSSAHLIIVPWLFNWDTPALSSLAFDVALHLGTLAAVVIYFWSDLWAILKAGFASIFQWRIGNDLNRKLAWMIVIGTIPAVIVGFLLEDFINLTFHPAGNDIAPWIMLTLAATLFGFGLLMLLVDTIARHDRPLSRIRFLDAILIGLAQTLALFPGVSRSGSTLTAGLALGFQRDVAARYSFLLAVPVTLGAGLRGLLDLGQQWQGGVLASSDLLLVAVGVLSAGISGILCIHFLLRYLRTRGVAVFVIYRGVVAAIIAYVALARM
jgi:undecaprenyl-diphosphatase